MRAAVEKAGYSVGELPQMAPVAASTSLDGVLVIAPAPADDAHDLFLAMLEPDQMFEAHVNLIQHGRKVCHAQRPDHAACPLITRCRFVDPKAP